MGATGDQFATKLIPLYGISEINFENYLGENYYIRFLVTGMFSYYSVLFEAKAELIQGK